MAKVDIDAYISENTALRRKLESKAEALLILSEELTKCRKERDELKNLSQTRNFSLKELWYPERYEYADTDSFEALKEKNKALFIEIRDLRHKLQEAYSDLKVLRSERANLQPTSQNGPSPQLKEELVQEVEETKAQLRELRSDLQALLDEKEELVTERDAYRCKVHRLNHQMTSLLKTSSSVDIDAILMENKYVKERLDQALEEIDIARQTLAKYKGMLDKKKLKGSMKLGNTEDPGCRVITHKQVLELLEKEESIWRRGMMNKEATLSDLRGLCMALVDSLQDKTLSLAHQKKANRILAERVKYLEERLMKHETVSPSQLLLDGYSTSEVDNLPPIKPDEIDKKDLKEDCCEEEDNDLTKDNNVEEDERLPKELEDLVKRALQEVEAAAAPTI